MKISKRIVSMLVVMVLCIGIFPISTFAAGNIMHGIGFVKADSLRLRSKPNSTSSIIDEAQNLTPHEVKTIISRAGEDTKMVLTGDPQQIDNPYLDASSNGLTYTAERMKNTFLHAHISLQKSERSELSALAAQLL